MLSLSGSLKVFLAVAPCDLRKSFNGLHGMVTQKLGEDPRNGALFVFLQSAAYAAQGALLRWDGVMGVNQEVGEGDL